MLNSENKLYYRKGRSEATFTVKSKKMKKDLSVFGIIPRKTATITMPQLKEDLMPHLIRGMIDGDGWISHKSHQIGFCGNERTVTMLRDYLIKTLNVYNVKVIHSEENLWQVTWASQIDIEKIGNYIYTNKDKFYLKRKYENFLIIQGNTEITNQITQG